MSGPANASASAPAPEPEPALAPAFAGADAEARPAGGIALEDAYRHCARLARSHYENFNVGGCVTPKDKLPHIYAIYAWCRTVDDLGDEAMPAGHSPGANPGDSNNAAIRRHRLGLLDWWQSELDAVYSGRRPEHPASIAVQHTVGVFDIPRLPFDRLIHANRIDQGSGRFATRDDVLEYCRYSANPVGHLYLYLFGYADAERRRRADCTCTALQLTNFWQDVARDYRERNRIYLPQADLARYGVRESDIAAGNATPAFRALLREHCDLARELFREGAPLAASLGRPARLPVALFTRGGVAVLDAIRRQDYDVLGRRPALSKGRKVRLLASALLRSRLGRGYGLAQG